MKKSALPQSTASKASAYLDLTFPDLPPEFGEYDPNVSYQEMIKLNEERLPWFNSNPQNWEMSVRAMCDVPFRLD